MARSRAKKSQDTTLDLPPPSKRWKVTPWQRFLKQFGKTKAAKEAISFGPGHFNRVASEQYNNLGTEERARIVEVSVKKAGGKVFAKIQTQFTELERLGYRAMTFGFFKDDVQTASTA